MSRHPILRLVLALVSALAVAPCTARALPSAADDDTAVRSLKGMTDEGSFTYYVNEEYVGESHSKWHESGAFENEAKVVIGGQTLLLSLKIEVDESGCWTAIRGQGARGPLEIERAGSSVRLTVAGKEIPVTLGPGALVMEDMSPALMSQAVLAYDHEEGGKQEFPLFFVPMLAMKGALEYVETFERFVAGKHRTFRKYVYHMPPVYSVHLVVDEGARVCFAEYPAQHGVFIREGYDALNAQDASDALLSKPEFDVIEERNTLVPMRDGVALATDLYRPKGQGPFPAVLVRTPYKKEMGEWQARFYARRGYAFAVQDVRGRFASQGEWRPFFNEARDGYDAVEWLAAQPWCDGKVGMIGGSYLALTQWWAASQRPPHLVTLIPNVSPPEPYSNFPGENGVLMLAGGIWWLKVIAEEATADISGMAMAESFELLESEHLKHLPVIELDEKILRRKNPHWREWLAHPDRDEYWRELSWLDAIRALDLPVFHQSGWFDGDGVGSKLNYLGMVERGHANQKLVLGPWGHTDTDTRYLGEKIDFGPRAIVDLQKSYLRWMDRWLKGISNGIDKEPSVSLFVMGTNDWIHGNTYPLEGTKRTRLYLASEGNATSFDDGDGVLTFEAPKEGVDSEPDRYVYDPGDPTPIDPRGRKDLLVYKTPPMTEPMTIAGPLSATLYASSSAKDTDWVLRLARIDREGRPLTIGKGVLRARYRDSFSKPKLLEPGEICEYRIDLWQTGVTIDTGESLTLVVASALFPHFSRNLNTGANNETTTKYVSATQTIHHDAEHPSHVLLPVVPTPVNRRN